MIFIILHSNKDKHKILKELEIRPNPMNYCGVRCPRMSEKIISVVNTLAPSFSIESSSFSLKEAWETILSRMSSNSETVELAVLACLKKIPIELQWEHILEQ